MKTPVALLAAVCLALIPAAPAATYTVTDLGTAYSVNGFQSKVINESGQVIGNEIGTNGHAFLYSGGMWNDLGQGNNSGMGNHGTTARGLNNAGLVVGQSDTGNSLQADAFFRAGLAGSFTSLGLVTAANANQDAVAYGCNDRGTIVGNVINYTTATRETFLYVPGTGLVSRKSDGIYSFAINHFGDVLGSTVGLVPLAVLNGVPLPAKIAGFAPHAINNVGQILLSCDDTHPIHDAWGLLYDYGSGRTKVLGNLQPHSSGYTTFLDLNDAGHVVGRGSDENLVSHAVLYTPEKGLTSLDALGLTVGADAVHLTEAEGINNADQIVCLGYTTDPDVIHTFLLTPDTTPVLPLAAAYDGLAQVTGTDTGAFTITITKTANFTAKLLAPGVSYSFTGKLTADAFTGPITVKGVTLTINLQADATHHKITGTIADGTNTYDVTALRQAKLTTFKGKLTALLQIPSPPATAQGIGYGKLNITPTGAITIVGQLGDGTRYTIATKLHYDGTWTFYTSLYPKTTPRGGLAGLITFDRAATDSDCRGTLHWVKPGSFTTDVSFKAAYFKAVKDTQLLRFTNTTAGVATFAFTGGEQTLPAHTLSVSNKNVVTVTVPTPDPAALTVKLSTATGALSGSFIHDVSGKKTTFTGVVQQKLNLAGGLFPGTTTPGSVLFTPQ